MIDAMTLAGFHHRITAGKDMFLEDPDGSARDAVHVLLVGRVEKFGEPNPDIEPSARRQSFVSVHAVRKCHSERRAAK